MGTKNKKLFIALFGLIMASSLALTSCSLNEGRPIDCKLVRELKPYNDLKATASAYEEKENFMYVTFENKGDQYVPLRSRDSDYCYSNGLNIDDSYSHYKCPFENRFIAPGEKIKVLTSTYPYKDRTSLIDLINSGQSIMTCYYTSEYTGMEFRNPQIKIISEQYRNENQLFDYCQLFYEPSGKFVHGDNYHLLINFTYDNEEFTVLSNEPNYETNSFGLSFEYAYYRNLHNWDDPDGYYKDYVFDENKVTINWLKCYTAWSISNQSDRCRNGWRVYKNPTIVFFSNPFVGIGIGLAAIFVVSAIVLVVKNTKKKNKTKNDW